MKKHDLLQIPSTQALEAELERVKNKKSSHARLRNSVYILIIVAAVTVLLATLFFPVMRIYGTSMDPTMKSGDIVIANKNADVESGDVIAFYYNNKILVKRVIGSAGDWIDMDETGKVLVNGVALEEPYLSVPALGDTNIEFPYQVPDGKYFVMGDNRGSSIDSRNTAVGSVSQEQIVGKVVYRIWPFADIGFVR